MEEKIIWMKRGIIYLLGLFIMAMGVSVSLISDLGVSPVNSLPCVISKILKIDMGICTTGVFTVFIIIQLLILRKHFKKVYLLQILGSIIFGFFVSVSNRMAVMVLPVSQNYGMQLLYIAVSVVLVAMGILLYLEANILSMPAEGVMKAVSHKTGIHVSTSKLFFDWTVVIFAGGLSLLFMGELIGVREGTIVAAIGVGLCLKAFNKYFQKPLREFILPSV